MTMTAACARGARATAALLVMTASVPVAPAQDSGQTRWSRYLMGTSIRVEVYDGSLSERQTAVDEAFGAMGEIDRLMSNYRADSELSHLNQSGANGPVKVSPPMLAVLTAAERVSRASNGAFDVTVGPLVSLWGFKDKHAHLPTSGELARVRPVVDYRLIRIDADAQTVQFVRPGVEIDLGGIAKGFAVELAAAALRNRGLNGMIDAGGNQYFIGRPPGKSVWSVGIANPDKPDTLLGTVDLSGGSLSTSANTSNFLQIDGKTYGHLLDPHTLRPSEASLSVTIASPDGTLADALSKAVFILGPRAGLALLDSFPGTAGIVAYREADGRIGIAVSPGLAFHTSR